MEATSTLVIYDLRDPEAWAKAGDVRKVWGKAHSEVHTLDADHIAVVLKPGGAKPESEDSA